MSVLKCCDGVFRFRRAPWRLEERSLRWTGSQQDVWSWKLKENVKINRQERNGQQLPCKQTKQHQGFQQSKEQPRTLFHQLTMQRPVQTKLDGKKQSTTSSVFAVLGLCMHKAWRAVVSFCRCLSKTCISLMPHKRPRRQTIDVRRIHIARALKQPQPCNTKFWCPASCQSIMSMFRSAKCICILSQSNGREQLHTCLHLTCLSGTYRKLKTYLSRKPN